MENLFPFLIAILYFAFKIYSNFQKEQEKARSRRPSQPAPSQAETAQSLQGKKQAAQTSLPQPFLVEERYDPNRPFEPQYKHVYTEEVPKEGFREPSAPKVESRSAVQLQNPEVPSEETLKARAIHKAHHHRWEPEAEQEVVPGFDFRDAIIKEAILNRPDY